MGSSKKHKEKHSKKDRKRRRSRSRSRSRERTSERQRNDAPSDRNLNEDISSFIAKSRSDAEPEDSRVEIQKIRDERNRDRDYQDDVDRKWRNTRREREYQVVHDVEVKKEPEETARQPSASGDISLSIEETNKLRIKLGLKPLEVGIKDESAEKSYADRDDVHRPAKNIAEEKAAEKLKLKMEEIREKRLMRKKLGKVKAIADDDDDPVLGSASSWVEKSRQKEKERKLAAERAKQLEQMDEEFGISNLASEVFSSSAKGSKAYSSRDLKGLKIEHDSSAFDAEAPVVLTLKDKGILEDDNEDVLINVNLNDDEKTAKNIENRKKGPAYKAYDDAEDDSAMFKARGVLEKYDEEIDGVQQKSFRLGRHGDADLSGNANLQRMKQEMKAQQVTLEGIQPSLARDFYTEEEMVKFNKPKRKRKVRKRGIVKADDLIPLQDMTESDLGSRSKKKSGKWSSSAPAQEHQHHDTLEMDMDIDDDLGRAQIHRPEVGIDIAIEEDEAELELQMALERSRRRTQKQAKNPEEIAMALKSASTSNEDGQKQNKGLIVLDSTSEFCRALGDAEAGPSAASVVTEVEQESDQNDDDMEIETEPDNTAGGWEQVTETVVQQKTNSENAAEEERVLDDEPVVAGSVGAALRLASMKGYLESGKKKERNFAALNLPQAKIVIDEEKLRDEERGRHDRGHDRDRDRERYDPYSFKEKDDYKPNVKLEYIDQHGRDLTPKEAFRYLSHKFHGKGSGKMKTEKRNKKVIDDMRLQKMSSVDTPLNLVQMMSDKQQQTHTPFVVLSGGGKNLLTSSTKLKK